MKEINQKETYLKNMDLSDHGYMHDAVNKLCKDLNNQLDSCFIEGLKRKGFEFETKPELEQFIIEHCRCEDNVDFKERVYYVDYIPFFLHRYEVGVETITEDRKITMSANYGSFAYL